MTGQYFTKMKSRQRGILTYEIHKQKRGIFCAYLHTRLYVVISLTRKLYCFHYSWYVLFFTKIKIKPEVPVKVPYMGMSKSLVDLN